MGIPHIQNFAFPKIDLSTTSTTSFDVLNGVAGTQTTNSMPWGGTIKRVLFGYSQAIGSGSTNIIHNPDGANTGRYDGPVHNFAAGPAPDILIVDFDESFIKDEGIFIKFLGDGIVNCALRVTMEVEFDFV